MTTQYLVPPHGFGAWNKARAPRTGERMAKRRCGVVVISRGCDEVAAAADPVVLTTLGTVPDPWDASVGTA